MTSFYAWSENVVVVFLKVEEFGEGKKLTNVCNQVKQSGQPYTSAPSPADSMIKMLSLNFNIKEYNTVHTLLILSNDSMPWDGTKSNNQKQQFELHDRGHFSAKSKNRATEFTLLFTEMFTFYGVFLW